MPANPKTIQSFQDAQKQIQSILAELNAKPELALAAAANPVLALEELGYELTPQARLEIEDRVRFGQKKAKRIQELRSLIFDNVGHTFDLQSDEDLSAVLEELRLPRPRPVAAETRVAKRIPGPSLVVPPQMQWGRRQEDPLDSLRGTHPVIEPLLEYRRLESSEPRLASREVYAELREGKKKTPVLSIRARLKSQPHR